MPKYFNNLSPIYLICVCERTHTRTHTLAGKRPCICLCNMSLCNMPSLAALYLTARKLNVKYLPFPWYVTRQIPAVMGSSLHSSHRKFILPLLPLLCVLATLLNWRKENARHICHWRQKWGCPGLQEGLTSGGGKFVLFLWLLNIIINFILYIHLFWLCVQKQLSHIS